ncbi:alpha/beta hydrolase [Isoptericola sp. NPDC019693]|uniref:alpha/beta hydrolase n=1 Tax=Isoptericola sp. NPDC019693 TaxID=3364009 RepID=UPI00379653CE
MGLPWRVRILSAALNAAVGPAATMSDAKRRILRAHAGPRWIGEFLNGRPESTVVVEEITMPGPAGDIPARLYRPPGRDVDARPLIVTLPGGGFVYGDEYMTTWLSSHVAARLGAVVVSPGYRLAPEHPAPAAGEDCFAVTCWVADEAGALGGDAARLAVVGESAGATLTATVTLMARDRRAPRIRAQGLLQGAFDLRPDAPMMNPRSTWPFGRPADAPWSVSAYLGDHGDPSDPLLSPLLASDHANLPPAFVLTADHDYLRQDGERYAAALSHAGVRVDHAHFTDSPHGIFSFPGWCAASGPALDRLVAFLDRELSATA